jgi:outer membrane immunogenic protein
MKKLWLASAALVAQLASPAMAADWPVMAPTYTPPPPPPPPAIYSWWTGCYLGGNLGGAWTRAFYTLAAPTAAEDFTFTPKALLGGGQLGCQYQWDSLVLGVEGTWSWTNLRQSQPSILLALQERSPVALHDRSIGIDQIGTVTARVGYTWDRTMLYGKAGWAGVRVSARASNVATGEFAEFTDFTSGWTVGVGMEHVPWQSIVLGVEANYYNINGFDHSLVDNFGVPVQFSNTSAPLYSITVRASYLFGPPIVTRYVN